MLIPIAFLTPNCPCPTITGALPVTYSLSGNPGPSDSDLVNSSDVRDSIMRYSYIEVISIKGFHRKGFRLLTVDFISFRDNESTISYGFSWYGLWSYTTHFRISAYNRFHIFHSFKTFSLMTYNLFNLNCKPQKEDSYNIHLIFRSIFSLLVNCWLNFIWDSHLSFSITNCWISF